MSAKQIGGINTSGGFTTGGSTTPQNYTVQGTLVLDNGLVANGVTVRLYSIGFANDSKLGETQAGAQGQYSFTYPWSGPAPNLQLRIPDPANQANEIPISATIYGAASSVTLNLVVPGAAAPLAPEWDRLSASSGVSSASQLAQAQENATRQDLTLLSRATGWDSRLLAIGALAAQLAGNTGLDQGVLYALGRVGLPLSNALASVPAATVEAALTKANASGVVSLTPAEIDQAKSAFQTWSATTLLASTAESGVSSFKTLLSRTVTDATAQTAFANVYFSPIPAGSNLWAEAAKAGVDAATVQKLQQQGKLLFLTRNNDLLANQLASELGAVTDLSKLADLDFHKPDTWTTTITGLAGSNAAAALIPAQYQGASDPVAAYANDLARQVRLSFPEQTVARMVEHGDFKVDFAAQAGVAQFLRAAAPLGYKLGYTPLNPFLAAHGTALKVDAATTLSLKILQRLFQVTPSMESLRAALASGLTSANQIASYSKSDFLTTFGAAFPPGEAELVYAQAQMVAAVTLNVAVMAKGLDTLPPVYAISAGTDGTQAAKAALVQQLPSMSSLFGNIDFCQCEDCRSVLSPAAYFVDLLDMLDQPNSKPNGAGNSPLDVLLGKSGGVAGRRPDLGALPLTCENTNTALPYIDLVNEILEYFIANQKLDAGAAIDTGTASTEDLIAEPANIIPSVYTNTLKQALYPLGLPFDLWIETVRGFLRYFKLSLAGVLETLRPTGTLELFSTPQQARSWSQILAEVLLISPAEYAVFTATVPQNWFLLYGCTAADSPFTDLTSAKTLASKLGVSYQEMADLVNTAFVNPALYPLLFQFERYGIELADAFSFTDQPAYQPLDAASTAAFQSLLARDQLSQWITQALPPNYAPSVLVLADPSSGCDFSQTTLCRADGSAAQPLDFLKLNLFVRIWKKLGWSMEETDRALQVFFPGSLPAFTDAGFAAAFGNAWKTALIYMAHLDDLNTRLAPPLGRLALLPLWTNLPTTGENPLYAQLFLTPGILNADPAFEGPNGQFPNQAADILANHTAAVQGALGLAAAEIDAILLDADVTAPAAFSLDNLSICYRYSILAESLQISVANLIALRAMSGLNPFQKLSGSPLSVLADDVLGYQTLAFVKLVTAVLNSSFSVEDLQYLLRHQYDPNGQYSPDPNAAWTLIQSVAGGLASNQTQSNTPPDLATRQVVIQALAGNLGADPQLVETLITNVKLLADPAQPGMAMLSAFLGVSAAGADASYFASVDGSGSIGASGMVSTADTSDPAVSFQGMASARFQGYLQVPVDGSYQFFATLGNAGTSVALNLDSPSSTPLFANPILQGAAASDGVELSVSVTLKAGLPYTYSAAFSHMGSSGARILIQGEQLSKGPLSQVSLMPQSAVDAFERAETRLAKSLQIVRATGLDPRELGYFADHPDAFGSLDLNQLPSQASEDSPANAAALLSRLLVLIDYAALRNGPGGKTDGFVDVFQAAAQGGAGSPAAVSLAALTRRDPAVVADVATALGAASAEAILVNTAGLRRVWDALQLVQVLRLPVASISASLAIVTPSPAAPDTIAAQFRNAVKSQFTADQWRPLAQSVFDPLRQKKRDALVAYLVNALALESTDELFEYFLVDPGMEPVVQTSRLRLALSSIQTFIQRCFLNLENGYSDPARNIAASAIPADWWSWMKRYRVWEANREIFLFPENWMQPELRTDQTDLFETLESSLLQGDVTEDLAESAFADYLTGLDLRARLQIVSSYLDQNPAAPTGDTLYVLGRTYGHPHKYFFRTLSNGTWSGWNAITFDIDGDHVALAVWRGRLNLFWLTFLVQHDAPDSSKTFSDMAGSPVAEALPSQHVQVQLNWSDYVQGKWNPRITTDIAKAEPLPVLPDFDPSEIHIHISKETGADGSEGALRLHLDFQFHGDESSMPLVSPGPALQIGKVSPPPVPIQRSFRITSRNCDPGFSRMYVESPLDDPYESACDATLYPGSGSLQASFQSQISETGSSTLQTELILGSTGDFDLLACANAIAPPFNDPTQGLTDESAALVSPFFFQDADRSGSATQHDERSFFVQPALTETTVWQWQGWAIGPDTILTDLDSDAIAQMEVVPQVPSAGTSVVADPTSVFALQDLGDWVTNPATVVKFGTSAIGQTGQISVSDGTVQIVSLSAAAGGQIASRILTESNS